MNQAKREALRALLAECPAGMLIPEGRESAGPFPVLIGELDRQGALTLAAEFEAVRAITDSLRESCKLVCGRDSKRLAVRGTARATFDRAQIEASWLDRWSKWFPDDLERGTVAVLHFRIG